MRYVSGEQAKAALERAFYRWGLPQRLRFDNGHPFAHTGDTTLPTNVVLWLVSLGLEVVFNRPACPQQNGTVECMQRISSRWANPQECAQAHDLQAALDHSVQDHLQVYRLRRQGDATRQELYPELFNNPRTYDPENIDPERVKAYLLQFAWVRKVFTNGRISLFDQTWPVGCRYAGQQVQIKFNPTSQGWQLCLTNGKHLKDLPPLDLSPAAIAALSVISKNLTT